jgi:uncharacterized protein
MKLERCSAVITGASAGIGREFARQLAPRAKRLILVARRRERLQELREQLIAQNPALDVTFYQTDLSDLDATAHLCAQLANDHVDLLINNAGLGDVGPFATANPRRIHEQVQVNVFAPTALTRAILPRMIAQNRGAILNVSSSAGFLPLPGFAVYAATKAYLTSFSEAIRAEVRSSAVTITTLCPGPVSTEFSHVADRQGAVHRYGSDFIHVSVQAVVEQALRAVDREKPMIIPGIIMKAAMTFTRAMPLAFWRLAARFTNKGKFAP